MLFNTVDIFWLVFPILKKFEPIIWKAGIDNNPFKKVWTWFVEKWVFQLFRNVADFEK